MKYEKTQYFCDCCRKEIPAEGFTKVTIKMAFRSKTGGATNDVLKIKDVCDECMLEMGFNEVETRTYMLPDQERTLGSEFKKIFKKLFEPYFDKVKL